jgi:hypothetical protein
MAISDRAARAGTVAERLLANQYAQENLRTGVESLRAAYRRASKRRVRPAEDRKVREQVRRGTASIAEAARAFKTGRQKPERHRGRLVLVLVGAAAAGTAAAVASSEKLREKLFGRPAEGPTDEGAAPPVDAVPT